ncbi:hypothetical protein CSUI_010117, partial [Cystoisospora suis]
LFSSFSSFLHCIDCLGYRINQKKKGSGQIKR